ncbi:hypothetical protein AtNW77_Chr1g0063431 [Arabidopsis thaliana]|uniref:Uncharacterized protein n=2 Tax=Arabidopsis TaxID=3701 RepID=A0A178W534_ARATH|nr:hypothetical protein ISN45_At01g053880 [Arabidopsis thaliana x Arabidopsis arenosa]OAP13276.1 hypothetical protein AXX17_AT1G56970 [Arabidopsis thaliana]
MAQSSENVLPTLRDFFDSKKAGEEDEFLFYRALNSSCKKPPKPGNKAKERHGFFNQGSKERRRRKISDAEKFSVEQYSSGGFFGVRLNTNGRQQQQQQQRLAKPLVTERNMEPRLQKSLSARMQFPFMPSSKGSNESSSTNTSSSTSWFNRIKKMSNPFSNRNPLLPESGQEMFSRNKSSPVHLHAHLRMEYELGMPVFIFSLDLPDDVYMASTRMDDKESRFVYSFSYIGGRSNKNVSGKESSLIGQMQVSTQICLEQEPYEEDLVASTVSEFVLFDIARARRSGFKHENLSRQNSFRRGLIFSETENSVSDLLQEKLPRQNSFNRGLTRSLSKHSENTASGPWPVSDLHPGLEIAAIVIQDSSSNSKLSSREMKVIVPTGNHGLPDTENSCPTPILQRWRSGGGCDCSGWDMGCHLFVLESPELINNHHGLELFIESGKEITPAMTMTCIREGHYEVKFHAKLSALQAFSICVAELHRTEVSRGERNISLSRCSSLRELIEMETPMNTREVLPSFMPNVTFSPISRV